MFIPHNILQTQPTMIMKVIIWRNAERRLNKKAAVLLLSAVGAPHNTVNADINVPKNRKVIF
jgi:hypothetical protein